MSRSTVRRLALMMMLAACSSSTEPSIQIGIVARIPVTGTPFGAAVSSAGVAYVTQSFGNSVSRINLPSQAVATQFGVGLLPTSITFNQAGSFAYVANQDGASVMAINTSTNAPVNSVTIPGSPLGLAVVPGDAMLLVGTDVGRLYFVSLPGMTIVDSAPVGSVNNSIAIHGTTAYVNGAASGTITRVDLNARQATSTLNIGGTVQSVLVSQDGAELYVANEIGQVQFFTASTGALAGSVPLDGGGGFGMARNPANGLLYVSTSYYGRRVHVIDPASRTVVDTIDTGGTPRRVAFTSSGIGIVPNESGWVDIIR
jgi:YVTN family beta-propeller protein